MASTRQPTRPQPARQRPAPRGATYRPPASPRVGMLPPFDLLGRGPEAAAAFLAQAAGALMHPAPAAPTPIISGGRSEAAIRRAGRLGDGWLGIWNPPRRFAAAVEMAAEEAAAAGRPDPPSRHAMQVWCGLADSREEARASLAPAMQAFYQIPFERFERYCPYGTADDVAEFLAPYADAGCVEFNLVPQSPDPDQAIAGLAAVKKLLAWA